METFWGSFKKPPTHSPFQRAQAASGQAGSGAPQRLALAYKTLRRKGMGIMDWALFWTRGEA